MKKISSSAVERISQYRRLLERIPMDEKRYLFSHELASLACVTPARVRRDMMNIGCNGNPSKGYLISDVLGSIAALLDGTSRRNIALVGIGNLGRAVLSYFMGRRKNLRFKAAFDSDRTKVGRVISGCRCYGMEEMKQVLADEGIKAAVLAVPADAAQETAEKMVNCGIRAILNYTPVPLRLDGTIFVENRDMTSALEKVVWAAHDTD